MNHIERFRAVMDFQPVNLSIPITSAGPDARQPDPEDPVTRPQPRTFRRHLENGQLLAESEILGGDDGTRHERRSTIERDRGYNAHRQASVWVL